MGTNVRPKRLNVVGAFIRQRREALDVSQRQLGQMLKPAVTTQFISNVERGVTPLPPAHLSRLAAALELDESDITDLMQQEFSLKISGQITRAHPLPESNGVPRIEVPEQLQVVLQAYSDADERTRTAFLTLCESVFNIKITGKGE